MALNISQDILDRDDIKLRRDKRGEIIRIDFEGKPQNVELCVDNGTTLTYVKPLPDTQHISSWASHINVYDVHNKKPVLKSSFMKARKAKSPDKMRASADLTTVGDIVRITVQANQYKIKKNRVKPMMVEADEETEV